MPTTTFARYLRVVLLAAAIQFGGGVITPAFAGPEALPDYSKGKNVMEPAAPVCDPRWYISLGGGIDADLGGTDINHGFTGDFLVDTIIGPVVATADIKSHDWSDVYDDAWRIQGEIGYVLTRHIEIFGLFKYAHADATGRTTGSRLLADTDGVAGILEFPLTSEFGDYTSWGGELGFRYFLCSKEARIRPYLALSGGATHVDSISTEIRGDFTEIGGPTDFLVYRGRFFNDSWVGTAAAMLGLEFRVACHWSLGVEGGVRYETTLDADDSDFHGVRLLDEVAILPLKPLRFSNDDSGDRFYCPVNGYLKFRF